MTIQILRKEINKLANPEKARLLSRFFKTGKGEYGEGDVFLGIVVPEQRRLVKKFAHIELEDVEELIKSRYHEERLIALLLLVQRYEKNIIERKKIFDFYLNNTKYINNWDLVDLSAPKIIGHFLYHMGKEYPLYKILLTNLMKSDNIWERRIAVLATFYFIKNKDFSESLVLAEFLLKDGHDLIHKAVGWMLREIGKKDILVLKKFLNKNYKIMPRTMLRYAIEKLPEKERKAYLKK